MHHKLTLKGFVIDYVQSTTKGFDPTSYTNIAMVNQERGVSLFLFEFWGDWRLTLPSGRDKQFFPLFHGDRPVNRLNVYLRHYEAPTIDEIEEVIEEKEREFSAFEDPMGPASKYE